MKKNMNIKLLLVGSILLSICIDARPNRSQENNKLGKYKMSGAKTTATGQGTVKTGGTLTTATSGGKLGASRTASTSLATGHNAETTGAKGRTVTSTNGSHTATNSTDTKSATVTNKQIGMKNRMQGKSQNTNSGTTSSGFLKSAGSFSPMSKFAAVKASRKPSTSDGMPTSALAAMSAEEAEQNQSSQQSSDSSSTASTQNSLFTALAAQLEGTQQVSSNASKKPGMPTPLSSTTSTPDNSAFSSSSGSTTSA